MAKVVARAKKMLSVAGMLEYGIEDRILTARLIISLTQYEKNISAFEIIGSSVLKHEANIAAMRPPPQSSVKIGVQIILDSGAISGS